MLEILLIRHGATEWNQTRRVMGRLPIPLNATGRRQAEALRKSLRSLEIEAIYTSPVQRALQTSRKIIQGRKLRPIKASAVAEIDYGRWIGKSFDEISHEPGYRTYHSKPGRARAPGGESIREVWQRTGRFIEKLRKRHRSGRVIVVSHADVIKAILIRYLKLDLNDLLKIRIDNCSLSSLLFDGSQARILGINCHSDLLQLFDRTDQLLPHPK